MSDDTQQPIVVKKIKKGGGGAHGGAWKIAYADFVTAMMAFFLLMWLLGSTAQGDLKGISEWLRRGRCDQPDRRRWSGSDPLGRSGQARRRGWQALPEYRGSQGGAEGER